jgi:putative Mg2+ transporter-C (MgtC) family protein
MATRHDVGAGSKYAPWRVRLTCLDGRGVLREALAACTNRGFTVAELLVEQPRGDDGHPW